MLGQFSHFFAFFSNFFRIFGASLLEVVLGSDFSRFFMDLGSIWGGFLEDVSTIFRIILENSDLAKTLQKPWFLQCFVRIELLKINKKSRKNM